MIKKEDSVAAPKDWRERKQRRALEQKQQKVELLELCKSEIPFMKWTLLDGSFVIGQSSTFRIIVSPTWPSWRTWDAKRDKYPAFSVEWMGLEHKNPYGGWGLPLATDGQTPISAMRAQIANYRKVVKDILSFSEMFDTLERELSELEDKHEEDKRTSVCADPEQ